MCVLVLVRCYATTAEHDPKHPIGIYPIPRKSVVENMIWINMIYTGYI